MKKYEDDDDVVFSMEVVVEGKDNNNNNNNNYNNIVKKVNMIVDNKEEGPYLVWEEITVVVGSSNINNNMIKPRRKLLNNLSGYAKPNRIMALMGPSGSGKSTLLDAFSGRLSSNTEMIGNSYLTQEDVFLGTLTVRETITYSAHLRVSNKMSKEEIENLVEKTIEEMGLEHCADNKIGNWYFRGISGGEKKRLSIGLEILTQPQIMLLDEPTTGLDSASAFFVVCTLGNIAHNGRIVVCSIHQPSGYLFDLFDDLYLLSGGEAVYFGDAKLAVKFFAEAGFPCPTRANPTDHFLRCVNSDFDNISTHQSESTISVGSLGKMTTQDIKEILIHKYNNSKYATFTRDNIQRINSTEEVIVLSNKSKSSWWKQMYTLTDRSFVNMRRDVGYYWLRMVYNGEMLKNHYGASVVMISNFISSFPFLLVTAISTGTIIYEMVKLHPGFSHYSYFVLNLFCCLSVIETLMMLVAFMVPNVLMGIGLGTGLIVFMMMASEIFRPICDLPKFFWRYPMSYISFASWALQGVYKNDMIGIEFDPLVGGNPKLKDTISLHTNIYLNKVFHQISKRRSSSSSLQRRLSSNVKMTGNIHVKGKENNESHGGISYLTQEDIFLGTLTVRETITYSAHLRVSNKMRKEEIENLVEKTIEEMGLQHCADNKIGNWYFRGISGGEKKRLSIGLEILTQPQIMLLDEPTTGLDSASAFFVVCTLRNIAHNGRIVVCSIHQPSGYLFDLFDDLYLLSGGEAVYFGDAKLAVKQLYTLTDRSFVNMRRDVGYYWLRMIFYLGVAVCTGILYYNIHTSFLDIIARAKCQGFVYGFMICLSNGGLPSFIEETKNDIYFFVMISNFISSFPFLLVTAISTGTIIYEMVKLHPGFSHYSYFVLNLFCCLSIIETLMILVAFMVFMMMASDIFRPICDLPKLFWQYPMTYISFASWALQGVFKNDMIGIEFDPLVAGEPKLKGEIVLQTMFKMHLNHSKWWDLAALVCLLISHRLIFLLVLKYKDTISLHSKLYFNKVIHRIGNMRRSSSSISLISQSFNVVSKKKISSSKCKTLHSLSSQLDLSSPMRPS
ncbi:hypothetical protein G4B88_020841 [Cannabis sativa]|uniref:ABC transporter domain-containing protein n=1 Tax=Cannabis sativa TaxID=3483 RepID=A0A7J6HLS2_CANSA|nr:hypothetical protein G4B88_020841 [Cannabis sativa]